jgi:wyosine [tRNA(Phe)-imidazoG37] synthetase (radical SAM superfamily)
MSILYGPVPSWRLGRSLGIDLLSTATNTCSFDCVYCQLGPTINPQTERMEFVSLAELAKELESVRHVPADYATFSGMGEPTLAANLGKAIETVGATLRLPVAVLTNSSLIPTEDVRRELGQADLVVAKVDAATEEVFQAVNSPFSAYTLAEILQGLERFRADYRGKLALQMMFIEANRHCAREMARIAKELSPDEVQINTPLRPCAVRPLPPEELAAIRHEFSELNLVTTVYDAPAFTTEALNADETVRRRPQA